LEQLSGDAGGSALSGVAASGLVALNVRGTQRAAVAVYRRSRPLFAYARAYRDRDEAIAAAYASGGCTLKKVGAFFGLHYAQVSRIARKVRDAGDKA
jgi:hypothetical protein